MTDKNQHDSEATPKPASVDDILPMMEEVAYLGANPKLVTTVKAWDAGKPPGGKLPPPASESKTAQEKS